MKAKIFGAGQAISESDLRFMLRMTGDTVGRIDISEQIGIARIRKFGLGVRIKRFFSLIAVTVDAGLQYDLATAKTVCVTSLTVTAQLMVPVAQWSRHEDAFVLSIKEKVSENGAATHGCKNPEKPENPVFCRKAVQLRFNTSSP